MAARSSEEFPVFVLRIFGGLPDTFERPAALGGRDLVIPTERFPQSKGAVVLAFRACFTFSFSAVSATRGIGVRL